MYDEVRSIQKGKEAYCFCCETTIVKRSPGTCCGQSSAYSIINCLSILFLIVYILEGLYFFFVNHIYALVLSITLFAFGVLYIIFIALNSKANKTFDYKLAHTLYILCLVKDLIAIAMVFLIPIISEYIYPKVNSTNDSYGDDPDGKSRSCSLCFDISLGDVLLFLLFLFAIIPGSIVLVAMDLIYMPYIQFQQYLFLKYFNGQDILNEGIQQQINNNGIGVNDSGNSGNFGVQPAGALVSESDFNI